MLRLAGVEGVSEDDMINTALSCSHSTRSILDVGNSDPNERGGTTAYGRQEIMGKYGLSTDIYPIPTSKQEAVSHLSNKISTGHGVIVSVDAGVLWNDYNYLGSGHAISLISVSDSGDRFIYSDTGTGQVGEISASRLSKALTGRPANITRNIIR